MNKSYNKIRHIQESNIKLEKRLLREQKNCDQSDLKAKFFYDDKLESLAFNAIIFARKMAQNGVIFTYKIAGEERITTGFIQCGQNFTQSGTNKLYFTPEALKIILCNCDDYVLSNAKPSNQV